MSVRTPKPGLRVGHRRRSRRARLISGFRVHGILVLPPPFSHSSPLMMSDSLPSSERRPDWKYWMGGESRRGAPSELLCKALAQFSHEIVTGGGVSHRVSSKAPKVWGGGEPLTLRSHPRTRPCQARRPSSQRRRASSWSWRPCSSCRPSRPPSPPSSSRC